MDTDDDSTDRLTSLTNSLRALERFPSESNRPPDATLPLIREPLFAPEPPAPQPPAPPAKRPSAFQTLARSLRANQRLIGGVGLALVVVVVAGAGIRFLWPRLRSSASLGAPAAETSAPANATGQPDAPVEAATATATATATASTAKQGGQPAAPRATATARTRAAEAAPGGGDGSRSTSQPGGFASGLTPNSGVASPGNAAASSASLPDPNATFNAGDADVVPPAAIDAQTIIKLRPVPPGVRSEALIIAVVIDQRGLVDSVKAVMPPRDLGESVVLMGALSSAKSWRFRPATKNGHPVKFRQIFALADTTAR